MHNEPTTAAEPTQENLTAREGFDPQTFRGLVQQIREGRIVAGVYAPAGATAVTSEDVPKPPEPGTPRYAEVYRLGE
ncbi:MAG: hypothetical protein ACK4N5_04515, partial [Myxococcales bacterium]